MVKGLYQSRAILRRTLDTELVLTCIIFLRMVFLRSMIVAAGDGLAASCTPGLPGLVTSSLTMNPVAAANKHTANSPMRVNRVRNRIVILTDSHAATSGSRDSSSHPAIHFEDYPGLSGYDCPDGSHLDVRDARKFTRALVRILRVKNRLPAAALQS